MPDVTVIGLGDMGSALAGAFLANGHRTTVWNRSPHKADALVEKGALRAATIAEAVEASRLVVVCLLTYDTVYEALRPADGALAGRVLVNLTNGTPKQAREMAAWAAERGAAYLDGGIMAVPPMIGGPDALIFYSGSEAAFGAEKQTLASLGKANHVGEDAGLASLYDIGLLSAMYGMFAGFFHAVALVGTEKVPAEEFTKLIVPWINAMAGGLPALARQIDARDYKLGGVVSNVGMQAAAFVNVLQAAKEQGLSTALLAPMQDLMNRSVADGDPSDDLSSVIEVLRRRVS